MQCSNFNVFSVAAGVAVVTFLFRFELRMLSSRRHMLVAIFGFVCFPKRIPFQRTVQAHAETHSCTRVECITLFSIFVMRYASCWSKNSQSEISYTATS